jgi:hypothetical protein
MGNATISVSSRTINHFTEAAYLPERREIKDRDCLKMLRELRSGRGMELEAFYLSEWVKQNRSPGAIVGS